LSLHLKKFYPKESAHLLEKEQVCSKAGSSTIQSKLSVVRYAFGSSQAQALDSDLICMIVSCRLSFRCVEDPAFRMFVQNLNTAYTVPCRQTITARPSTMAARVRSTLHQDIRSLAAVSFTMDGWSEVRRHYFTITVHFVTGLGIMKEKCLHSISWRPRRHLLNCIHILRSGSKMRSRHLSNHCLEASPRIQRTIFNPSKLQKKGFGGLRTLLTLPTSFYRM
jgi:hypothetical protein